MIKKVLVLASVMAFVATTAAFAADDKACDCGCKKPECVKKFDGQRPDRMGPGGPGKMDPARKAEFEKKHAEFEARLKLTDEQKAQAKAIREKGRADAEAIIKKLEAKRAEYKAVEANTKLKDDAKNAQIEKIRAEKMALRKQLREMHKASMKEFEAILTPAQQKELTKMKQEGREKFEQNKKGAKGPGPKGRPGCGCGCDKKAPTTETK